MTKENQEQLCMLGMLIEQNYLVKGDDKLEILSEIKDILKNKSLDLDNVMGTIEKPIIIQAAIWYSKEILKLLLEENIDILKTFNFYLLYDDYETEFCRNEDLTCLDILVEKQTELKDCLNHVNFKKKHYTNVSNELKNVEDCITLIKKRLE